ncbi:MAG: U32 family peptidase [Mollicutes bacterium]|nr:U32 family peptidase [Mollicutes bacterium]MDD7263710.1 U32 family peptidase [bacterium]MDY4979471.1 U32 family peptidase [Candidatus Onthovivens sp.]
MNKIELLAPVGDKERLIAAIHFGADAVYFAGKRFGLRAFADNFDENEIIESINYAHSHYVRVYITVNILPHNNDFNGLVEYLQFLDKSGADGVIVSDLGIAHLVKKYTSLELHVSTQANITNFESANVWINFGAKRLVLARELSLLEIKEIKDKIDKDIDIECFAHGAMCISYSGRCLLSNYFTGRDSNKGACAQPCRWNYALSYKEDNEDSEYYPIEEDSHGTYILNSKDLCLIEHIKELNEAGINSFKIEGRMKSTYYVATVINAYRRAIDNYLNNKEKTFDYIDELRKTSNRDFTTGFYFNSDQKTNKISSKLSQTYDFIALVKEDNKNDYCLVELRNKFKVGDTLEILSSDDNFNKTIKIEEILDQNGNKLEEVKKVKELVYIKTNLRLKSFDILRRKKD